MKITPNVEKDVSLEFDPKKHPVEKTCHLHLRWAKERCPSCGSALMMYFAPTFKHRMGTESASPEERHKTIFVSCVMCDFTITSNKQVCFTKDVEETTK